MSGGFGGGGDAWSKDHEEILEHARGLGYDKVSGVSLPPADAPKETWISAMDRFNAWKASELGKPEADRWWVTRPWSATEGTVSPEGSGGGGGSSVARPTVASSPVASNPYYPQLVQEYEAPGLMDYSSYMPADSMFGYEQYQPWTNPNNINDSIFNYQPPTIYAGLSRAPDGSLTRTATSSGGGRYISGGPSIGGGSESGSESSSSADSGSGVAGTVLGNATDYIVPGTGTSIQSLLDYQAGPTESLIYDEDGNIERKYYVNPDFLRPELVAADINKAKEQAYIEATKKDVPIVQRNLPAFTNRKEPITMPQLVAMESSAKSYIQDQIRAEQARIAREIQNRNPNTVFGPPPKTEADFANDSRGLMAFREAQAKQGGGAGGGGGGSQGGSDR